MEPTTRQWLGGHRSPAPGPPLPSTPDSVPPTVPERYEVRDSDDGAFLHCDDAPRVRVRIEPKLSVSEADARAMGGRSIFLDGAGDFPPKLDNKNRFYNLDHHQGCIRPFTLATCEQALVLVMNGLELDEGDWTLYANEPDLDTVFAIWVLLNFRRIPKLSTRSKYVLLPLVRLEGAIDANGAELADFCGLPHKTLREARDKLDTLYTREKEFRAKERSAELDWREYAAAMLSEVDQLVYTRADFQDHTSIEEILGHLEIADRKVAVACRDQSGIYEAERSLKNRFAEQLGIIALEKSKQGETREYTLRRVSALFNLELERAYDLLNIVDPAVNGRPATNRWGGSDDIGGSPRFTGTELSPSELLRVLQEAYQRRSKRTKIWPWVASVFSTAGLVALAAAAAFTAAAIPALQSGALSSLTEGGSALIAASLVALAFAVPATFSASKRRMWLFGWRRPAGHDWLYLFPIVMAAAVPANAWAPKVVSSDPASLATAAGAAAFAALAVEAWFRGTVHGWFLFRGPIGRVEGPWTFSRAASVSTFLYMLVYLGGALAWQLTAADPFPHGPIELGIIAASALAAGAALAVIRERSLSIWPCVLAQLAGAVTATGLALAGVSLF
ncbi:MAG: hypothetical protein GY944_02040 [bacterium]|nr:hypothetical protein [bacterium]